MSWTFIVTQPPGPYFTTESNQVLDALKAAGLNYCEQTESTWQVTGAQGGTSVRISADCSKKVSDTTVYIHTQKFDSVRDRDDAVRLIQKTINRNELNGGVYTYGSFVIAVQGPTGGKPISETLNQIKTALQK